MKNFLEKEAAKERNKISLVNSAPPSKKKRENALLLADNPQPSTSTGTFTKAGKKVNTFNDTRLHPGTENKTNSGGAPTTTTTTTTTTSTSADAADTDDVPKTTADIAADQCQKKINELSVSLIEKVFPTYPE